MKSELRTIQTNICSEIRTNDVIELQIPSKQNQKNKTKIQWVASVPDKQNKLWEKLINKQIENKNGPQQKNGQNYIYSYCCSALDYKCQMVSVVTIKTQNPSDSYIKKLIYSPIQIQNQLLTYKTPWDRFKVKIMLEKLEMKEGQITIQKDRNSEGEKSLIFKIKLEEEELIMRVKQNDKYKSFIRLYQNEQPENCIFGILITEQQKFKQFMRKLKISAHYGCYIKVKCKNRFSRDLLFLEMLRACEVQLQQPIINKLQQKNPKQSDIVKISTFIRKSNISLKTEYDQNVPETPKIPFCNTFGAEQKIPIMEKLNFDFQQDQVLALLKDPTNSHYQEQSNLIEQIYNILNTPLANTQKQLQLANFKFDDHAPQFCKNIPQTVPYNRLFEQNHKRDADKQEDDEQEQERERLKRNKKSSIKPQTRESNHEINDLNKQNKIQKLLDTSQSSHLDIMQRGQAELQKKIAKLQARNRQLELENHHLKEENLRLREKKLKNNENDITKMFQIRQMVKKMAKRLQFLQKINQNSSTTGFKGKQTFVKSQKLSEQPSSNYDRSDESSTKANRFQTLQDIEIDRKKINYQHFNKNFVEANKKYEETRKQRKNFEEFKSNFKSIYQKSGNPQRFQKDKNVSLKFMEKGDYTKNLSQHHLHQKTQRDKQKLFDHNSEIAKKEPQVKNQSMSEHQTCQPYKQTKKDHSIHIESPISVEKPLVNFPSPQKYPYSRALPDNSKLSYSPKGMGIPSTPQKSTPNIYINYGNSMMRK